MILLGLLISSCFTNIVVLQSVLTASVSLSVESTLVLPLLAGDVHTCSAQCPPMLLLASVQKWHRRASLSLFSANVGNTLSPANLDLGPWWYISSSHCLCVRYACPALDVLVWQRSSAAPHINSGVLSTTWAWHAVNIATLPYLKRTWALFYVDIHPPQMFWKECIQHEVHPTPGEVFSWRHHIMGTSYLAIFEFLLLFF